MTKTCWVLTDGKAGNVAQALGLAEATGLEVTEKTLKLSAPLKWLPPALWPPGATGLCPDSDPLAAPWPDLAISCGRQAIGPMMELKRRSPATFCVHVHHPRVPLSRFDLIAAPAHDRLHGANVIVTDGSLGRVNRARLDEAAAAAGKRFDHLPRPLIAVSIGGSNSVYRMDEKRMSDVATGLAEMARQTGAALLVTASRRTGQENERILRGTLEGVPGEIWDGSGDNPYFAYLGAADHVLVTSDSVNMVSEACATGRPVQVIHLPTRRAGKFDIFHRLMESRGYTRPFRGTLENWENQPLDETARVASEILNRMGLD